METTAHRKRGGKQETCTAVVKMAKRRQVVRLLAFTETIQSLTVCPFNRYRACVCRRVPPSAARETEGKKLHINGMIRSHGWRYWFLDVSLHLCKRVCPSVRNAFLKDAWNWDFYVQNWSRRHKKSWITSKQEDMLKKNSWGRIVGRWALFFRNKVTNLRAD